MTCWGRPSLPDWWLWQLVTHIIHKSAHSQSCCDTRWQHATWPPTCNPMPLPLMLTYSTLTPTVTTPHVHFKWIPRQFAAVLLYPCLPLSATNEVLGGCQSWLEMPKGLMESHAVTSWGAGRAVQIWESAGLGLITWINIADSVLLAFDKEQYFLAFGSVCASVCKKCKWLPDGSSVCSC